MEYIYYYYSDTEVYLQSLEGTRVAPRIMYHHFEVLQWNLKTFIISRRHYMTTWLHQP